jgi:hypothetical protein
MGGPSQGHWACYWAWVLGHSFPCLTHFPVGGLHCLSRAGQRPLSTLLSPLLYAWAACFLDCSVPITPAPRQTGLKAHRRIRLLPKSRPFTRNSS